MTMSLPLRPGPNVSRQIYARSLANAYQHWSLIYDPSFSLLHDPDLFEKVLRDPVVAKAYAKRITDVAGRKWSVVPFTESEEDKKVATIIEHAIKRIRRFQEARKNQAQAIFRGQSFLEIRGTRKTTNLGGYVADWWCPEYLKDIDLRRTRWKVERPGDTSSLRLEMSTIMPKDGVQGGEFVPVPDDMLPRIIMSVFSDEEARLSYGRGLLESIFFSWWFKQNAMEDMANWVERFSQGTLHVQVDTLRDADTTRDNATIQQQWITELDRMRSRHVLVYGKEDEMTLTESTGTGFAGGMDFIRYHDETIVGLINGSSIISESGEGGSLAKAKVGENTAESIVQSDRDKFDEDMTNGLIGYLWKINRPIFQELGLGDANKPMFQTAQEKREDPLVSSQVVANLHGIGIDLRKDEVLAKCGGFTPVSDDDRAKGNVIEGGNPVVSDPFGGGNPFGGGDGGDKRSGDERPERKPEEQRQPA